MKRRASKKVPPFTQPDCDLIDKLILGFDLIIFGVPGVVTIKTAIVLKKRLAHRRAREGSEFPRLISNPPWYLGLKFLDEFQVLLGEFVARDGLGIEYDKRRVESFSQTVESLKNQFRRN